MDRTTHGAGTAVARGNGSLETLLLRLADLASHQTAIRPLSVGFCRELREYFGASGVFCWKLDGTNLSGLAADGVYSQHFTGIQVPLSQSSLAADAVSQRRTLYLNNFDQSVAALGEFQLRSVMAAPLIVAGMPIGALVLVHDSDAEFFDDTTAGQVTIVASQIAQALESQRLVSTAANERRSSALFSQFVQSLSTKLDAANIYKEIAERARELFQSPAAFVVRTAAGHLNLVAVSARKSELAKAIERLYSESGISELGCVSDAIRVNEPLAMEIDQHELQNILGPGQLLAAPLKISGSAGAVVVHSGPERHFDESDLRAMHSVCGIAALAIANAEAQKQSSGSANDVQQLLEISTTLGAISDLDPFLEKFVVQVAQFLSFGRSFIASAEADECKVRWVAEAGQARRLVVALPDRVMDSMSRNEVFWTNDAASVPSANLATIEEFDLKQGIAAPLLSSDGRLLGVLGALDRSDGQPITPEDVRRAKALAAQVAVVLESTQNLHQSEQHRKRCENLMELALELNSSIRLPELVQSFTERAATMLGARAAAVALIRGSAIETVCLHEPDADHDYNLIRRLNLGFVQLTARHLQTVVNSTASDLLGQDNVFGWEDLTVARLMGSNDELIGLLCLADRKATLSASDESLIQAIAGHASVALENSRMFSRMSQANRHWVEIFDAISDLIVVHDEANSVLRVNRSLAEFVGTRPQEIIGINMRALMSVATENNPAPCPFCRPNSSNVSDEYVHVLHERSYLVSTSRIQGGINEGMQTIHVLKDITDRREAERRYRELFDNIQEGLFFSTPEGRFIEVNDALVRMLGYSSREELLQVDIPQALYTDPVNRNRFSSAIEEEGTLRNFEESLRRRDGSLIYTLQNSFAVRDAQGRVVQYRGLILDITDLKNFQAELQRQRDFNLKILNNTQSLILVLDTAGLISYGNRRCYESGSYSQEELLGRPMAELVPANRRQSFLDALYATVSGQQVDNLEMAMQRGDGRVGQFSVNMSPMRDEQGNVSSIVVVMTDITDAAVLQAKLVHTEKLAAVGQLVSGVAHEVNNPLTAILGFADLMAGDHAMPENARRDLNVIIQEAQRTKQIVQNLLSFARQMPPQRQPVQLNSILRRSLQLRAYDFANHGVEVVQHYQEALPDVIGDSHQLQQVFLNIINNAYDAVTEIGRPGRIEIFSSFRDGFVETSFVDNGSGITAPDRIFDPFFTTKEVGKGTGLGLSICYGIIREHGGDITCHNNVGRSGATFIVRLPIAKPEMVISPIVVQGAS